MNWITPIIDRTQSDVDYLKTLSSRIRLFGWDSISEAEKNQWLFGTLGNLLASDDRLLTSDGDVLRISNGDIKGAFNAWDWFRIVSNIYLLDALLLNDYSFDTGIDRAKSLFLPITYLLTRDDYQFIINAITELFTGFESTTPTHEMRDIVNPNFSDINAIEKNLLELFTNNQPIFPT